MSEEKRVNYSDKTNDKASNTPDRIEKRDISFYTPPPPPPSNNQGQDKKDGGSDSKQQ